MAKGARVRDVWGNGRGRLTVESTGGCRPRSRPSGLVQELLPGARRYSVDREAVR